MVAVIDGGVDIAHEDLKGHIWTNKKEVAGNGIDDDKNGFADDVNGWNFLANKSGNIVENISLEGEREFLRLVDKYRYAGLDSSKVPTKDLKEYLYFKNQVLPSSPLGKSYQSLETVKFIIAYADTFAKEMKYKYPFVVDNTYSIDHFKAIAPPKDSKDKERLISYTYYGMFFSYIGKDKSKNWKDVVARMNVPLEKVTSSYNKLLHAEIYTRQLVGDDVNNIHDTKYGTALFNPAFAGHGTHVAGIISADRTNKIGVNGVADALIMPIRVTGVKGDEYDKDVALAIRYAVDNGANIINMSFGKPLSPQKDWIDEALLYAQKKGVLVVHAAGNASTDVDQILAYPVKHIQNQADVRNFINVGNLAIDGNPAKSSNYGKTNVDIFAPGMAINSLAPNNAYALKGGTSMASPLVAGVAAFVLSYFPNLNAEELKEIILKSAFDRKDVLVLKPQEANNQTPRVKIPFKELCATGGIIDAEKAIELAYKNSTNAK
ncbi:S8 family serine peptidase [Pedobacter sp. MW01-1-1]|uniref:S8 family serine peptidase n=1 Tax=Pedobacter sp. MW01-1-1 TaxID=3383027 RepID=UPI003FEF6F43